MAAETEFRCMGCGEEWVCYEDEERAKALEHIRKGKQ